MTESKPQKTFVRGSYLYMQDGQGYQEGHKDDKDNNSHQKVVIDRLGIQQYQKQLKQKKIEADNKRKAGNKSNDRPTLIPIRDTPVQPIPQPVLTYQKCERATQQQFQYFQFIVNQKEKQKQFQQQQNQQISQFLQKQKKLKEKQIENPPSNNITVVMQKEEELERPKKKKGLIKIKIKKKVENEKQGLEQGQKLPNKIRVLDFQ